MITVGFSTSNSLVSRVIRKITRSPVSHTYLGLDFANTRLILQTDERGVNLISRRAFLRQNQIVFEFRPVFDLRGHLDELLLLLGSGYDFAGLLGQLWVLIGQALGRSWNNPYQSEDRWYCSELVGHYLHVCGEELPCKPSQLSPARLLEILQSTPLVTPIQLP